MRFLIRHGELNDTYIDGVCRVILQGVALSQPSRNGKRQRRALSVQAN
jgi:hypothetical protein